MQEDNGTIPNSQVKVGCFADYVIRIIRKLSEQINGNDIKLMENEFIQINIELLKDENCNGIQLTYCGGLNNLICSNVVDILRLLIGEVSMGEIDGKSAFVHYKTANKAHETIYNLRDSSNVPIISEIIHFPHLKEYLSVKIQHKLKKSEINKLKNIIIEQLLQLQNEYQNVKYTFHAINGELLYTNPVEFDYTYLQCQLLSSTITQILKLSLNNEFRAKCFELLNIDHSEMANDAIINTLLSLFHDNYELEK